MDYTKSIDARCMDCGHINQPHETKNLFYITEARYCERCGSKRMDVEYPCPILEQKNANLI